MAIPEWVAAYVGIPYLDLGDTVEGADCQGLAAMVWREQMGRELPRYTGPGEAASNEALAEEAIAYSRQFDRVELGEERLFDGILWRHQGYPIHLAVVVDPGRMLHMPVGGDSLIERYPSLLWPRGRIAGIYRFV